MLQSPLALALFVLTAYYGFVAAVQHIRSKRSQHALMGAAVFAGLTAAVAVWPPALV
ncbi:MAG TPA: hypothetical protein VLB29_15610 [Nocardioidaceae bacterium]|nr:hypothetical protein [Nocardioidaceae bacterium]